ncbi:hypothetical protein HPB52_018192 [Rhipicephalus sanguineus]|uniref:Mutator-like transposase domain-containing protein n=1 Tax=Rhipicephalus sanguineus TaxID=34632 RepID=A0A9D4Q7W5_RHISA|nr:hypothetical protein HPB52_018192 [Rhipicephalus sanguineus]
MSEFAQPSCLRRFLLPRTLRVLNICAPWKSSLSTLLASGLWVPLKKLWLGDPFYYLPSCPHYVFKDNHPGVVPRHSHGCEGRMHADFQEGVESISLTSDMWTSRYNQSYISLTCHYLTSNFEMRSFALENRSVTESHTACNILEHLQAVMDNWELPLQKVPVYVVTDNARNFRAALRENLTRKKACIAKELGLTPSTLNSIVAKRIEIEENARTFDVKCKQARSSEHVQLDKACIVKRSLASVERGQQPAGVTILDAMHYLASAWSAVTAATVEHCFNKCFGVRADDTTEAVGDGAFADCDELNTAMETETRLLELARTELQLPPEEESSDCVEASTSTAHKERVSSIWDSIEKLAASSERRHCTETANIKEFKRARDSFAVNVKSVVAARAIGVGHEQLVRFCAILGAPKPMHHKTFTAIGQKVHTAAMKAAAENLARARELTAAEAGSTNVLSNYCLSCSRHKALEDVEEEIWQAFHTPVDGASSHKFCPDGDTSWCKHKRAQALGEPAPPHTPILTPSQGKPMLPVYKRLTEEKLLQRCVKGQTQNAAESLNSKIWLLCLKTKFATRTVVETATAIAVLWFNQGHSGFEEVLQELGVLPSKELLSLSKDANKRRISSMTAKVTAEARAHRRSAAKKARLEEAAHRDCEGPTYGAGSF